MSDVQSTYSIFLLPEDNTEQKLQTIVDELASSFDAPRFPPHLTVVASILSSEKNLDAIIHYTEELVANLISMDILFTAWGYTEEEFRCLFLKADPEAMSPMYEKANVVFPQVNKQHFKPLPHISMLYGNFQKSVKEAAIARYPITPIHITFDSIRIFNTDLPISSWREIARFNLTKIPIKE